MRAPRRIQEAEDTGVQLLVGVVALPGKSIGPNVGRRSDVSGPELDVVVVENEPQLPELVHERGRPRREIRKNSNNRLVVFVKKNPATTQVREEREDSQPYGLQLLPGDVLFQVDRIPKPTGLVVVV